MQNQSPLNKVVFIQKVAIFIKPSKQGVHCLTDLFQLAYVNNSWNDTIKNYAFHLFEERVRGVERTYMIENIYDRVIKCDVIWFLEVLLSSEIVMDRINNVTVRACRNETLSLDMMKVVFEKVEETGGKELLKSQLTATNSDGLTCFLSAIEKSSSLEVMNLIFQKISEVGGAAFLKIQITATRFSGDNCLMLVCRWSSSLEVMKLLFEKIVEAGGKELLKSHLGAFNKYGLNCLLIACWHSSSRRFIQLLIESIIALGGKDMLKSQISATDDFKHTCLRLSCSLSSPSEIVKLITTVLFELDLFTEQFSKLDERDKINIRVKADIKDACWTPDDESIVEVKKILKC